MSFSSLVTRTVGTNKYSSRLGDVPDKYLIHHVAGTNEASAIQRLSKDPAKVSSNLVLTTSGEFVGIVPREYRAWTTGSQKVDGDSITVETVNTTGAPDWKVAEIQVQRHAEMAADCARTYGWGGLDRNRVMGHRQFMATACPGPFLYPKLDDIVSRGNAILLGSTPIPPPAQPTPQPGGSGKYRVVTKSLPLTGRAGPGTGYTATMTAAKGHILDITEVQNGWARSSGGHWYSMQYLSRVGDLGPSITKYRVVTRSLPLTGRSGPGTNYPILGTAAKGYVLDIVEIRGNWARSTGNRWYSLSYLQKA